MASNIATVNDADEFFFIVGFKIGVGVGSIGTTIDENQVFWRVTQCTSANRFDFSSSSTLVLLAMILQPARLEKIKSDKAIF
ncbi:MULTISPECIES: hypothetical protein [Pseudomonas]|uniref:hypothetical protein n=1 Tax=Pseudomonas TaxID=286 RepID=UPI001372E02B|nr:MULTISPECIES: hypothetical protein [Pseudomonas]NAP07037.1 hypothetical protein [Pseudomonas syringae]NAP27566.1 hypothetical protein [Pseudomonas syringae]NAP49905.1 hypothetical protein [Pseudomonas syringae]NAP86172.1 hypothetical protein [Pseudomonas syringae]